MGEGVFGADGLCEFMSVTCHSTSLCLSLLISRTQVIMGQTYIIVYQRKTDTSFRKEKKKCTCKDCKNLCYIICYSN